jgi:hypothetical protein
MSGYDIIGDVHGEGEKLVGLLHRLGYIKTKGVYQHPDRQAIFVGDLIDRGKQQEDVLKIVGRMQKAGTAQVIMGNHEFNAIAYASKDPAHPNDFMREHNDKNKKQHEEFLGQLSPKQRAKRIEWFKTWPLWLDLDEGVRIIHACWHEPSIRLVEAAFAKKGLTADQFFLDAANEENELYGAVEILLKGPEMTLATYGLPAFLDKGGDPRRHVRIRWWNSEGRTVSELAEIPPGSPQENGDAYPAVSDVSCDEKILAFEYRGTKPVLFGHYWRNWAPAPVTDWTPKAACVDFSAGRGGPLVAYHWDGEDTLSDDKYVAYPEDQDRAPTGKTLH